MSRMRITSEQLVVSVEHASHAVPKGLGDLGLSPSFLRTHHGWDPGAAAVGRRLAKAFAAPLHLGRWTRLVADLNRSAHHRRVVPPDSGRQAIPGNAALTRAAQRERLNRYWSPYREAVEADLDRVIATHGRVLHLSVHSFTPRLRGVERNCDIGLLYQPSHAAERAMADRWHLALAEAGYRVRRNYPYSGRDDGFCMRMRAERPLRTYLGMEIEMNQKCVRRPADLRRLGEAFLAALRAEFAGSEPGA